VAVVVVVVVIVAVALAVVAVVVVAVVAAVVMGQLRGSELLKDSLHGQSENLPIYH
jgi:hypothetical protein